MPKGNSKPKTTARPQPHGGGLSPKARRRGPAPGGHKVTFSFEFADRAYEGDWSWPDGPEAAILLTFLCDISNSTWDEIRAQQTGGKNRHKKHHSQAFDSVVLAAQQRITERRLNETFEEFFRFRLGGEQRLWGFQVDGVFYVLWWDQNHMVTPTGLRHT